MTERPRGLFISFEGSDGSGKSTQLRMLAKRLRAEGYACTENVEPGGTPIGIQIRRILLDPASQNMASMTELLLMFASRTQAVAERISPALARGEIVLSDRFTDSSLAYQGEGRGLGFEAVRTLHTFALGNLMPDLTICIELEVETSLARAHGRNRKDAADGPKQNRLDEQSLEFHRRVRQGYERIAAQEPHRFRLIDGSEEPGRVAEHIWETVRPYLENLGSGGESR